MNVYERRIFPWLNDRLVKSRELELLRAEAVAPASGRVVEVGFGTGLNLPHYSNAVTSVVGVEPNDGMLERARPRIARAPMPVDVIPGRGEALPLPDSSFDTAVMTLTLCSVSDPIAVLHEVRRVLRAGGRLIVLEHGLSEDAGVARWQRRLNRIQNVLACGCNITRPVRDLVEKAGFRFESIRTFYAPKAPRTHGWITMGVAII